MPEADLFLFLGAWFMAGLVNGISGMGAAMVAVPVMNLVMPPTMIVPVACLIVTAISIYMAWVYRAGYRPDALRYLLAGGVPGSLAGLGILLIIPPRLLQFVTGSFLIIFVLWQFLHSAGKAHPESRGKALGAGFAAGVLTASISFGNPPVGVYALHVGWDQRSTMGTMNLFAFGAFILTCVFQAGAGLYTPEILSLAAYGIPAALIGLLAARPLVKHIHTGLFRKILLVVIGGSGLLCILHVFGLI